MDIKIVTEGKVEEAPKEAQAFESETVQGPENFDIKAIGQVLGLEEKEFSRYDDKLNTLLDYAKMKTEDHSPEGLKWAIRNLELKLGTPQIGEKLIDYITRYAYLELEELRVQKEKEKFYGNNI